MALTVVPQRSTCLAIDTLGRCRASKVDPSIISKLKHGRFSVPKQNLLGLRDLSVGFRVQNNGSRRNMKVVVHASVPPGADPSAGNWKIWILGAVLPILLSFTKGKWGPLLKLTEKVETTVEEAEKVSDVIEEVAETVKKVADEAVDQLPQGKLRDAVEVVEDVAEEIDKDAHIAGDALEKVEKMDEEVESLLESTTQQEKTVTKAEDKDQK